MESAEVVDVRTSLPKPLQNRILWTIVVLLRTYRRLKWEKLSLARRLTVFVLSKAGC